jgi:IS605 OrfB family transposase
MHAAYLSTNWIGVDLNTTGYAVVVADPMSRKILKLGKRMQYAPSYVTKNCTKLYREGKLWKLKKEKTRERKNFRASLNKIARQIVAFAESACAGIKFERLFTYRYLHPQNEEASHEFSFENGSFVSLLRLVERRAGERGIPVMYVNPTNTSKRCCRCGGFGRRTRKRFECPHCGSIIHADVNAAFNIAATSTDADKIEAERLRSLRKKMRRLARAEKLFPSNGTAPATSLSLSHDILTGWTELDTVQAQTS